jgi:hypothetical protein
MLRHTFCHIPGIGGKREAELWAAGVTVWDKWQEPLPLRLSAITRIDASRILAQSKNALAAGDPAYFSAKLGSSETWRMFSQFREHTAYLDIETTGLDDFAQITTIALYDGKTVRTYVHGQNLEDFVNDIGRYRILVSYNGKSFDIPMLERHFRIRLPQAQIDLRYVLSRLGIKGGLKSCEKQLGMNRGSLDGVDGSVAVHLWYRYQTYGEREALDTLLAYNVEDTINLERILVEAYNRHVLATPFGPELCLPYPEPPSNPYQPDLACLDRVRSIYPGRW